MYTAEQLSKMSLEDTERIIRETPEPDAPTIEELEDMNVGIYDESGRLIGEKEGSDY